MFKQVLGGDLTHYATVGLIMFVVVFAVISVWALTRSRTKIDRWASIPLDDGPAPLEPRPAQPTSHRSADAADAASPLSEKRHG